MDEPDFLSRTKKQIEVKDTGVKDGSTGGQGGPSPTGPKKKKENKNKNPSPKEKIK